MRQGTFYPELTLGAGGLSSRRRAELGQFLVALVRRRGFALHLANLWNALYFNYDLDYGGFRADHLEQQRIPARIAAARQRSLPVGGFVRVHTEMKCGDLLAEVIYKEGAHPDVTSDWVPPALSGAPATITDEVNGETVAIVSERFVLDLAAFGPDGIAVTARQYERLCRKARWLDGHGHLLLEAMYAPEGADLDDIDYYADYLLKEHREGLLAFCFTEELSDPDLREALVRSFEAVRAIAVSTNELRSWRDAYFFAADQYAYRLASSRALGCDDLRTLYRGLAHLPNGELRTYSAIGPRLIEFLTRNAGEDDGVLARGPSYASAVCHTNLFVAETLAREQQNGLLPISATVERPTHLRLDDDWQAGGIWRAERVEDAKRCSLATVPPTIPLGLGFAERAREPEITETLAGDEQPIASSQTGFRVALTLRDRALGRLRLSAGAASALAPGAVEVVLKHGERRERYAVEREGGIIYGIEYPWELHPGIVLSGNVEAQGSVVRVRMRLITPPIVASDGTCFDYETNLAVYERELRLKPLTPAQKRQAPSLRELVNRAFRICGRRCEDGARALTLSELATVIFGPAWRATDTLPLAKALAAMELNRDGADYLWRPIVSSRARASDRSLLAAYGETKPRGRIARSVLRHWVSMHLRHYALRSPSEDKRLTYAEARLRYRMHGVLPEELPRDCTWVEPHSWGGDHEAEPSEP